LELNYPKGVDGVAILNGFVSYAIEAERQKVASDMSVIVKNRLNEIQGKLAAAKVSYSNDKQVKIALLLEESNLKRTQLEDELKALRSQLKNLRLDRISQLDEAIGIARSLSIYKPTTPSSMGEPERSSASVMRTEINNQQVPLYFMGVEALSAEKVALQRRTSDDFADGRIAQISKELQLLRANREVDVLNSRSNEDLFLSGVQSLYAESARLQSVNVDMMSLKLVTIDKYALEPLGPTKPKRLLVILLGLAVGLILGIGIATAAFFVRRPNNAPQNFMQIADLSKAGKTDH
jgi:LPS O-antigen subunit length determinant protein (WzzB/FepE family)